MSRWDSRDDASCRNDANNYVPGQGSNTRKNHDGANSCRDRSFSDNGRNNNQARGILRRFTVLVCLFFLSGMALHHGWVNYDQETELDYTGIIQSNDIGNPHTYIDLEVIGEGAMEENSDEAGEASSGNNSEVIGEGEEQSAVEENGKVWNVVLAPLSRMRSRGLTDDGMLAVDDTVRVIGYPHREIDDEMRAETIIINGNEITLR